MNQSDMIPVDFKVSRPSGKYLNSLVNLRCGPDMLLLRLFPNAKEVTESFGAYEAVAKHLRDFPRKDPNIRLVVVGDGHTPRTAATFAFRSAWECYSVDPVLNNKKWDVERLMCFRSRIQDMPTVQSLFRSLYRTIRSMAFSRWSIRRK